MIPKDFFRNEQLDIIRNQLRAIFNEPFRKKEKITLDKIKRIYQGESASITLLSAFAMYLKMCWGIGKGRESRANFVATKQ